MANGPMKITGLPFDETLYESQYSIEDDGLKVTGWRILFLNNVFLQIGYVKRQVTGEKI